MRRDAPSPPPRPDDPRDRATADAPGLRANPSAAPPGGHSFGERVRRDFRRLRRIKGRGFWTALLDALLFDAGFQALLCYRCGSALRRAGVPVLPAVFRRWAVGVCGVDLLPAADIGGGCVIAHGVGLVVGGATVMGEDCTLLHGVTLGEVRFDELACPLLGDRVTVGVGALVLGGITVGDDALIGAGAVVRDDVPAGARVAGVPARVIGWQPGYGPAGALPADGDATVADLPTPLPSASATALPADGDATRPDTPRPPRPPRPGAAATPPSREDGTGDASRRSHDRPSDAGEDTKP